MIYHHCTEADRSAVPPEKKINGAGGAKLQYLLSRFNLNQLTDVQLMHHQTLNMSVKVEARAHADMKRRRVRRAHGLPSLSLSFIESQTFPPEDTFEM